MILDDSGHPLFQCSRDIMNDSNRKSMSTSNIKSESSAKVKPKSRLDWREKEKENESPKSHGIAATNFHRKRQQEKSSLQMEEFKEIVEKNILILDKEKHSSELESKRKAFRQITCLKTWPLQHMAMDHLDHLLGKNCSSQFHGGDYLSSESSSSVESMEAKRRASPSKKVEQQQLRKGYMKKFQNESQPLIFLALFEKKVALSPGSATGQGLRSRKRLIRKVRTPKSKLCLGKHTQENE